MSILHYPEVVRFGALPYRVELLDDFIQIPEYPGKRLQGACWMDKKLIQLHANKGSPDVTQETFIHEVIEAINFEYDLKLPHTSIKTLGVALHQVFKENGPLLFSSGLSTPIEC